MRMFTTVNIQERNEGTLESHSALDEGKPCKHRKQKPGLTCNFECLNFECISQSTKNRNKKKEPNGNFKLKDRITEMKSSSEDLNSTPEPGEERINKHIKTDKSRLSKLKKTKMWKKKKIFLNPNLGFVIKNLAPFFDVLPLPYLKFLKPHLPLPFKPILDRLIRKSTTAPSFSA